MSRERFRADDPREWLRRAESNMIQARNRLAGVCLEDLCFQAQQAAEKSLKAVLLSKKLRLEPTHNLAGLLKTIESTGVAIPKEVKRVARLTDYAVEMRYPGMFEPATEEEYEEALQLAGGCVNWVRSILG